LVRIKSKQHGAETTSESESGVAVTLEFEPDITITSFEFKSSVAVASEHKCSVTSGHNAIAEQSEPSDAVPFGKSKPDDAVPGV
jgi:hypothetical protein